MNKKEIKYEIIEFDDLPISEYDGKFRKLDIKLIKYITNRVRKTIEYKNLIDYLKRTLNINHCSFYKDYSIDRGFTIELHHSPLTLFDYTEVVCNKHYAENDKNDPHIIPWKVEEEVNRLHYEFKVGLVPLNPTSHKLVHSGALTIHPNLVNFNWKFFISEYKKYLTDDIKTKIEVFEKLGTKNPDEIPEILKYKPVLINNLKFKSLGSLNIQDMVVKKLKERMENKLIK